MLVRVENGVAVPSITGVYPAAFVFENESHDLFGVSFEGISIDFGGEFYTRRLSHEPPRSCLPGRAPGRGGLQ